MGAALFIPQSQSRHPKASAAMQRLKAAAKVYLSKLRLLAALAVLAEPDQASKAPAGFFLVLMLLILVIQTVKSAAGDGIPQNLCILLGMNNYDPH